MDIKTYLNNICKEIKYEPAKKSISEELELHMKEIKENYINDGMDEKTAEEKAVHQMGNAEEIGRSLNKIHKPHLDWKLLILIAILMGFSLIISIFKEVSGNGYYIGRSIVYMILGVAISIGIYLFDYRKLKKCSFLIYIFATILMIMPIIGMGCYQRGVPYIYMGGFGFYPTTITVTLYIIAFIGFIVDYDKENIIKLKIQDEIFSINKDFIKILGLAIFSLIMMACHSRTTAIIILSFVYIVITTIKIVSNKENKIRNLATLYGIITFMIVIFIQGLGGIPTRVLSSFNPEIDPYNTGWIGLQQKDIMQNAELIGEANVDGRIIDIDDLFKDSNHTFIYLLGKAGIIPSAILVLAIILTSIKLIANAKNMKEQYGKFLIIGLSSLYIFQSVASVLMNINLGIQVGIEIPLVAYGGFYFFISISSMALILSVYRRKDINFEEPKKLRKPKILTKIENVFFEEC